MRRVLLGLIAATSVFASDYPLDQLLGGSYRKSDKNGVLYFGFEVKHKVTQDPKTMEYVYWYSVKNIGKEPMTYQWELVDKVMDYPVMIPLDPGQTEEMTARHKAPPKTEMGAASAYVHRSQAEWFDDEIRKAGVEIKAKELLVLDSRAGQTGPVPEKIAPKGVEIP